MEKDGKITVLPKPQYRPLTASDIGMTIPSDGLSHIIVSNGVINSHGLSVINKNKNWLKKVLSVDGLTAKDIFLMTVTDSGATYIVPKQKKG